MPAEVSPVDVFKTSLGKNIIFTFRVVDLICFQKRKKKFSMVMCIV